MNDWLQHLNKSELLLVVVKDFPLINNFKGNELVTKC